MHQLLVTPKNPEVLPFLERLLRELDSVGDVERIFADETADEASFAKLSEASLMQDWMSPEDDVWDEWLATRPNQP